MSEGSKTVPARPNIQLIAQEVGVAVSTVSRYLNNTSYVSAKTRKKIRSVIEKYNYQPNMMAQSLVRGHSTIIGVLVRDIANHQDAPTGILTGGQEHGMSVIFSYSTQDAQQEIEAVDLLVRLQARGIIILPEVKQDSREFCEYLVNIGKARHIPIVLSGQREGGEQLDCVTYDDKATGYVATKHLIDNGFERVGCITGSMEMSVGLLRYEGYRQALIEANICYDPALVYEGNFHKEEGYKGIYHFHKMGTMPRAVFCANDATALGVYLAAEELGIRIPEDLAVIGCDDIEISRMVTPKLSSVKFGDATRNGELLVDTLWRRIENPGAERQLIMLQPIVIERQSTRCN